MSESKKCFVICPIGPEESNTRERSDKLMKHIIEPSLNDFGYTPIRADTITEPGSITTQVIEKTVESELVIADLTDHNPNVFYELAVRHATGEPYIQLIESSDNIPFDISDIRTIYYDFDVERVNRAIEEIQAQIESIEQNKSDISTPISRAADLKFWRESEDPIQQNLAEITDSISQLNLKMNRMQHHIEASRIRSPPQNIAESEEFDQIRIPKEDASELLKVFRESESEDE